MENLLLVLAFQNVIMQKAFYEEAGVACPECGGKYLSKDKKGRKYFGCENNPECNFMSWNKPTGEKCPRCGSYMEEKGKKKY